MMFCRSFWSLQINFSYLEGRINEEAEGRLLDKGAAAWTAVRSSAGHHPTHDSNVLQADGRRQLHIGGSLNVLSRQTILRPVVVDRHLQGGEGGADEGGAQREAAVLIPVRIEEKIVA